MRRHLAAGVISLSFLGFASPANAWWFSEEEISCTDEKYSIRELHQNSIEGVVQIQSRDGLGTDFVVSYQNQETLVESGAKSHSDKRLQRIAYKRLALEPLYPTVVHLK